MTETPPITQAPDGEHLIELLKRQVRLFEHLGGLADRQAALITEDQTEALLSLLAQRQQMIDELGRLNADLQPFRSRWEQLWRQLDEAQRQVIAPLVNQAQQLLEHIMAADERDGRQLKSAADQIAAELGRLTQAGTARQAYMAGSLGNRNMFTNQQG